MRLRSSAYLWVTVCGAVLFGSIGGPLKAQDADQAHLCKVLDVVDTMWGEDGPLKGCLPGHVVHFQVDPAKVSYSSVVARYCDLDSSIVIEKHPVEPLAPIHVVCKYEWRWAGEATRTRHPDHQ